MLGRLLLDAFVVCYAASLILYFADAAQPRRALNRAALGLLFASFCFETVFLCRQLWRDGAAAVSTRFDVTLLIVWLILLVALAVNSFFRIHLVGFLANVLGFLAVVSGSVGSAETAVYTLSQGDLLVLHVTMAVVSYVSFAFSFLFSAMYLVQEHWLREKRWTMWFFRMPSLAQLDRWATGTLMSGVPCLVVAICLGAVWGRITGVSAEFFRDPKVWMTGIICTAYGILLWMRLRTGWGETPFVWLNIGCFCALVLNFVWVGHALAVHHAL
ncbi:MAG: cytochrome c biogenesis protein [Alicyclobacillus sp.]|nr:cytochrome c biogenesis protein [Alicyclobacillus sp.]